MARATIADVKIGRNSLEPAATALTVTDGGQFTIDGSEIVKLTATAPATVTIPSAVLASQETGALFVRTIALTAGQTRYVRVDGSFAQPGGVAHVDVSDAGVSALVLRRDFVDVGYAG